MLKLLQKALWDRRMSGSLSRLPWGAAWGGVAGVIVGMGINLNIGFFYDRSSTIAMYVVVVVCCVLGGFLGHVISSLYAENVMLMGHSADDFQTMAAATPLTMPESPVLMALQTEQEKSYDNKHRVIGSHASIGAVLTPYPDYHVDPELFDMIVAAAHRAPAEVRRA